MDFRNHFFHSGLVRLLLVVGLICFLSSAFGQDPIRIDSLKQAAERIADKQERVDFLMMLAKQEQKQGRLEEARDFTLMAIPYAQELEDPDTEINLWNSLGQLYRNLVNAELGDEAYEKSIAISLKRKDYEAAAYALSRRGRMHYSFGDYPQAMDQYLQALSLCEEFSIENEQLGTIYHYIGSVFKRQQKFDKALVYYEKLLELGIKLKDKTLEADGLYLRSQCLNDPVRKIKDLKRARDLFIEVDNLKMVAVVYVNMGDTELDRGNPSDALLYYNYALEIEQGRNDRKNEIWSFIRLAKAHNATHEYQKALDLLTGVESDLQLIKEKRTVVLRNYYHEAYVAHNGLRNYKESLEFLQKEREQEAVIYEQESALQVEEIEAIYKTQQRAAEVEALQQQSQQKEDLADEQQFRTLLILGFTVLVLLFILVFSILLFKRYQVIKRQKVIIEHNKTEAEYQRNLAESRNQEITDSITYAKRIQEAILPEIDFTNLFNGGFVFYKPKDIVAGDFYWMERSGMKVMIAVADCTGHGVPGAMVSLVCHNAITRAVREFLLTDPGKILNKTRELVAEQFEKNSEGISDGMDIALVVMDREDPGRVRFAGAYNSMWIVRNSEVTKVKGERQPIGKFESNKPFTSHYIDVQKGDRIYIGSDGFQDQFGGAAGKKLKATGMERIILQMQPTDISEQAEEANAHFEMWRGDHEQIDDVCMMGFQL